MHGVHVAGVRFSPLRQNKTFPILVRGKGACLPRTELRSGAWVVREFPACRQAGILGSPTKQKSRLKMIPGNNISEFPQSDSYEEINPQSNQIIWESL